MKLTPHKLQLMLYSLTIISLSFGQLLSFHTPWGRVYPHDLLISVSLTFLLPQCWQILSRLDAKMKTIAALFSCWIILGWLGTLLSGGNPSGGFFYSARLLIYAGWAVTLASVLTRQTLQLGLLFWGSWNLMFGLLQLTLLPDTRFLALFGWDDHWMRLAGTHFDPNLLGLLLILFLLAAWRWRGIVSPALRKVLAFLTIGAALATFSRSTLLTGTVLSGWLFWQHRHRVRRPLLLLAASIVLLSVLVNSSSGPNAVAHSLTRQFSTRARVGHTLSQLQVEYWWQILLGKGLFVSEAANGFIPSNADQADNWLAALLSGSGLIGVLLMLSFLIQQPWHKQSQLLQLTLLTVSFHALFNNSLFYGFTWIWVWLIMALEWHDATSAASDA